MFDVPSELNISVLVLNCGMFPHYLDCYTHTNLSNAWVQLLLIRNPWNAKAPQRINFVTVAEKEKPHYVGLLPWHYILTHISLTKLSDFGGSMKIKIGVDYSCCILRSTNVGEPWDATVCNEEEYEEENKKKEERRRTINKKGTNRKNKEWKTQNQHDLK